MFVSIGTFISALQHGYRTLTPFFVPGESNWVRSHQLAPLAKRRWSNFNLT
jgi:hypothetical protein